MPVDLRLLYRQSREVSADAAACDQAWNEWLRQYARKGDLLAYALYVHGEQATELVSLIYSKHAWVIAKDCEESRLTAHILPPEFGKSALARWEVELWLGMETEACYDDPAHTIPSAHYIMNTESQASDNVVEIEETIRHSRKYRELFPRTKPDLAKGWTKTRFFLQRPRSRPDASLVGCGIYGPIQGSRVGLQMVDDPTDQQDAASPKVLDSQVQWLAGTAGTRVLRRGIRRFRFTRWHEKDVYSRLVNIRGMLTRVMPCYDFWTEHPEFGSRARELWPDLFPAARLEAKRQELIDLGTAYLWPLQYLCSPSVAEGSFVKREWLVYGEPEKVEEVAV